MQYKSLVKRHFRKCYKRWKKKSNSRHKNSVSTWSRKWNVITKTVNHRIRMLLSKYEPPPTFSKPTKTRHMTPLLLPTTLLRPITAPVPTIFSLFFSCHLITSQKHIYSSICWHDNVVLSFAIPNANTALDNFSTIFSWYITVSYVSTEEN